MYQITINDISIDVIRKDIKNIHLSVHPPTGRVRIAAPLKTDDDAIRLFAISKLGWIKRHRSNFNNQERQTPREFKERESHYFQGKRYLLRIRETDGAGYVILKSKTYLDLYIRKEVDREARDRILREWYRTELKKILPEMIESWEQKLKVKVNAWNIRLMKTRWGSCNIEQKRLLFNLELAKKPIHCVDYIVLHEMLHLIERKHSERYNDMLDRLMPNWRAIQKELNEYIL
jgi:predicted metal-dependent hydrolase